MICWWVGRWAASFARPRGPGIPLPRNDVERRTRFEGDGSGALACVAPRMAVDVAGVDSEGGGIRAVEGHAAPHLADLERSLAESDKLPAPVAEILVLEAGVALFGEDAQKHLA